MCINEEKLPDKETEDFFNSLTEENEEKYINYIKNSSIKIWNYKNENGLTPLHQSISLNLYELSKEIILSAKNNLSQEEFNLFINCRTNKGQTALHYASFVGNIKLIKLLFQNGADISIKTNNNFNVLQLAVMGNKVTSLYYFIKKYEIDINSKDSKDNSCLHLATYFNSKKIFNYLLTDNQIKINSKNKDGFTPLHFAVINQNISMIKKLLMKGAKCSIKNNRYETVYDLAKKNNNYSIQNILKGNKFKYSILNYSKYIKVFLIFINLICFSFIFYIKFDIRTIFYIIWMIIYIFFIIRFYLIDATKINNRQNYLLNIIETEEKPIEEYCLNCQIIQNNNIVHCFICNKCIEGFDHHCFWINKCIGEKNINAFYHLLLAMLTHSIINFLICITGKNGKFNVDVYFKDYIMLVFILLNGLNIIFTSIAVCPLIKFYYSKNKEKNRQIKQNSNIPASESRIGVRVPVSDDEFV